MNTTYKASSKILFYTTFFLIAINSNFVIAQNDTIKRQKTISIMAVGDIMMGTTFPNDSYLPSKKTNPFKNVKKTFSNADVLFGNLEGTLTDTGENAKKCKDPSKCYSFKSPEIYGNYLKDAGFDVMSIANNHIGDFGDEGIQNTKKVLDANGISYAGVFTKTKTVFVKDSISYGFVAFAPNKDCLSIHNLKRAKKIVRELNSKCDIVIVSFHGGAEGTEHTSVPRETEFYYGEDRGDVYKFSHELIDVGADVILGHGPHVSRAFEVYKNRFIAYSLGNFCTYKRFNLRGIKGFAPIVEVKTDDKGVFIEGQIHSAIQKDGVYPFMDKNKNALKEIQKLTEIDFPESTIVFDKNGTFIVKK